MIHIIHYILHTHEISWVMHILGFLLLVRYSGIKIEWAVGFVFGIEIWEMLDWSLEDPIRWWCMTDTYMDIVSGLFGIILGRLILNRTTS